MLGGRLRRKKEYNLCEENMTGEGDIVKETNSKKNIAILHYEGTIRWGPPYFGLSINYIPIQSKHFGEMACWINEKFLVVEEWLTIYEKEGPITRLVLFNTENRTYSSFKAIDGGFVKELVEGKIVYRKEYKGSGNIEEAEVEIDLIKNWKEY
jgi:hypothetical protein